MKNLVTHILCLVVLGAFASEKVFHFALTDHAFTFDGFIHSTHHDADGLPTGSDDVNDSSCDWWNELSTEFVFGVEAVGLGLFSLPEIPALLSIEYYNIPIFRLSPSRSPSLWV